MVDEHCRSSYVVPSSSSFSVLFYERGVRRSKRCLRSRDLRASGICIRCPVSCRMHFTGKRFQGEWVRNSSLLSLVMISPSVLLSPSYAWLDQSLYPPSQIRLYAQFFGTSEVPRFPQYITIFDTTTSFAASSLYRPLEVLSVIGGDSPGRTFLGIMFLQFFSPGVPWRE